MTTTNYMGDTLPGPAHGCPDGEVDYLAKAGALLDKVADHNERNHAHLPATQANERLRLSGRYAQLAAIQRGQLPAELVRQILDQIGSSTE
jgi:hypothetical protein